MKIAIIGLPYMYDNSSVSAPEADFAVRLSNALFSSGIDITYYGAAESQVECEIRSLKNAQSMNNTRKELNNKKSDFLSIFDNLCVRQLTAKAIRDTYSEKFNILHSNYVTLSDLHCVASCPVLNTIHFGGEDTYLEMLSHCTRALDQLKNSYFCFLSQHQKSRFSQYFSENTLFRSSVIHHGLSASEFTLGEGKGDYVTFIGRMSPEKGPDRAIRVAAQAAVPIRVAGSSAESGQADPQFFEREVRPLLSQKNDTTYLGHIAPEVRNQLLANSVATLFTSSQSDAFGMSIIESLFCGTPVLALRGNSASELIEDGKTGFICEDEASLALCIDKCRYLDRIYIRQYATKNFNVEKMAKRYINIYSKIVNWDTK